MTLSETIQNLGLLLMSAALTLSVFEVPDDAKKVVLPNRPAPVWVESGGQGNDNNPIRREREDTAPHYISYSEVQRTPTRSGRN
ncbi:MAG TPA: hypothetical protein VHA05_01445 [Candidatus Saccharimonadales bacterium]|nr:hypothetical protein [Candidatus Saccharimonadales bacterium]